jgi:hypothetical protein
MTEAQAYELKDLFYRIKQFYFGTSDKPLSAAAVSTGEATEYIAALREAEKSIEAYEAESAQKRLLPDAPLMLLRACALIREALLDRNYRMAGDIAAASIRLIGVYTFPCLSRAKFWRKHILPLREKHEIAFFAEEEQAFLGGKNQRLVLSPSFAPRAQDAKYYDEDTDGEMLEAHPCLYVLFAVLGLCLLVGSLVGYGVLVGSVLALSGAWVILGYFGAAAFGISLFSLAMAWIHQYMGHRLTGALAVLGFLLMALSILLL